jgi:N-acetylmuramoyl-L-alanine amidase
VVVTRARDHFRLRFGGVFVGTLPDSFPPGALVRSMRPIAAAGGSAFELAVDPAAVGYRLDRDLDARRVTLELSRTADRQLESFAPQDPPGERRVRLVVIDPGHGGTDAGVVAGPVAEKDLTLALARRLKAQIERRGIRVVLTREDDRDVAPEARAELANRLDADLVIGLHFDGYVNPRARGATAFCPPATFEAPPGGAEGTMERASTRLVLLPWRDVAIRHAVQSRALAEAVLSALELRGLGPTRLREQLPYDLLGVNAPGILLECSTLTSAADRDRVTQDAGLEQLAATVADGLTAYQRND